MGSASDHIKRILADVYSSDPGRFQGLLNLINASASLLDDYEALITNFVNLWDIDNAPDTFLAKLAGEMGLSFTTQPWAVRHQMIRTWVETLKIKGTPASIRRLILATGATFVQIYIPYKDVLRPSTGTATLSGVATIQDGKYWRAGVYDIQTDLPAQFWNVLIKPVLPAGKVRFNRIMVRQMVTPLSPVVYKVS